MPRYRVIEYHSSSLTFAVDAPTPKDAEARAQDMDTDEGGTVELGTYATRVEELCPSH